jgi:hypothetical protein
MAMADLGHPGREYRGRTPAHREFRELKQKGLSACVRISCAIECDFGIWPKSVMVARANASLIVAALAMLKVLRQIARDADFQQEDDAMELGQRLIDIERDARAAITLYEVAIADWRPSNKDDADE